MNRSCPVCYEQFSPESGLNIARRLLCHHIICSACIFNDLSEDCVYFCPECCAEHHGGIDDFSSIENTADSASTDELDDVFDADSMRATSYDSLSTSFRSPRAHCSAPECTHKAISNGLCLQHSKKRHKSMSTADSIAESMLRTGFNFVSSGENKLQPAVKSGDISPEELISRFKEQKRLDLGEAMELIEQAKSIMLRESNILNLEAPLVTVGDVHGQFYDLLNLFAEGGQPGADEQYLFLGDYVDRGSFSCEVMFLLVALKVAYPTRVWLLRGNHECASVSGHFGFKEECKRKYGVNVYYKFLLLFQTMPLAAVISTAYGDIFACHGGLSPHLKTLDDISKIYRFVEPENDDALLDILWSDPVSEQNFDIMTDDEYEACMNIEFKANPARGCSHAFGYKAIREFLDKNRLVCIVRAHEVQELGFKKHFEPETMELRIRQLMDKRSSSDVKLKVGKEKDIPPLITIFSAPNYCDRFQNKGAILRIESALDGFRVIQYLCVEHPEPEIPESQTDNYILAITLACPYMPTSFRAFVWRAVELGPEEEDNFIDTAEPADAADEDSGPLTAINNLKSPVAADSDPFVKSLRVRRGSLRPSSSLGPDSQLEVPSMQETGSTDANSSQQQLSDGDASVEASEAPRRGLVRRASVVISMVRPPALEDNDDYNEPILSNFEDDSFDGLIPYVGPAEISPIRDEFGLPLHEDIVDEEASPDKRQLIERSCDKIRRFKSMTPGDMEGATPQTDHFDKMTRHLVSDDNIPDVKSPVLMTPAPPSRVGGNTFETPMKSLFQEFDEEKTPSRMVTRSMTKAHSTMSGPVSGRESTPLPAKGVITRSKAKELGIDVNQAKADARPLFRRRASQMSMEPLNGVYKTAQASDSINEIHPAALKESLDITHQMSPSMAEEREKQFSLLKEATKKVIQTNVCVKDMKKKFEGLSVNSKYGKVPRSEQTEVSSPPIPEVAQGPGARADVEVLAKTEGRVASMQAMFGGSVRSSSRRSISASSDPLDGNAADATPTKRPLSSPLMSLFAQSVDTQLPSPLLSSKDEDVRLRSKSEPVQCGDSSELIVISALKPSSPGSETTPQLQLNPEQPGGEEKTADDISVSGDEVATDSEDDHILFSQAEILALKLMFSLFDRAGTNYIAYDDLVAYGEETDGVAGIKDAANALEIVDMDGDGRIGLLDFIHFAARLKAEHEKMKPVDHNPANMLY